MWAWVWSWGDDTNKDSKLKIVLVCLSTRMTGIQILNWQPNTYVKDFISHIPCIPTSKKMDPPDNPIREKTRDRRLSTLKNGYWSRKQTMFKIHIRANQRPRFKSQRISVQDVIFWNRTEIRSVGPVKRLINLVSPQPHIRGANQRPRYESQSAVVVVTAFLALVVITTMVTMATLVMVMVVMVTAVFMVTTIFTTTLIVVTTFITPLFELLVTVLAVVVVVSYGRNRGISSSSKKPGVQMNFEGSNGIIIHRCLVTKVSRNFSSVKRI